VRRPGTGQDLIGRNAGVEFAAAASFLGVVPRRVAHLLRDLALQSGVVERVARVGVGAAASDVSNGDTTPRKARVLTACANVADGMKHPFFLLLGGEGGAGCEEKKEKESSDWCLDKHHGCVLVASADDGDGNGEG